MKPLDLRRIVRLLLLLGLALVLPGCHRPLTSDITSTPDTVAFVDGESVTASELVHAFDQSPNLADTPEARRALLDSIVLRRAQARQARQLGLDADPEIRRAVDQVLVGALRARHLDSFIRDIQVTDDEIKAYYNAHPEEFRIRPAIQVAALFLGTRTHDLRGNALKKAKLEDARTRAMELPSESGFGDLSVGCSEHQASRYRGGVVGWLEEGGQQRSFEAQCVETAQDLEHDGDISPVRETPDGLYLVRRLARRPAAMQALASVGDRIRSSLLHAKRKELEARFARETLDAARFQVFDDRLAALSLPPRTTPGTLPSE